MLELMEMKCFLFNFNNEIFKSLIYYVSSSFFIFHLMLLFLIFLFLDNGVFLSFCFSLGGDFSFDYIFVFDKYSLGFSSFVLLISGVVFMYRGFYLEGDKTFNRYLYILFFFVISILLLIFRLNFFGIIIGWDGLGLVSFLLVIYYGNFSSLRSGILTVLTNRFGDIMIVISFFYFFSLGVFSERAFLFGDFRILIILLFFSSMTKRAQLPFSAWLPAAIAAPTPVSSLVHSSTLVTAGVYLIIRFYELFSYFFNSLIFCIFSLMTMFFSGFLAFFETDIKKVVAISTLRQLGVMMFSISLGEWVCAFFHIVCHALFKSLLFLRCGGFIMFSLGRQDFRTKGGYAFSSPFFFSVFCFSSLRLCGFPFLSGFFSKDLILEGALSEGSFFLIYFFFYISCMFSLIYRLRLFFFGLFLYENTGSFLSVSSFRVVFCFIMLLSFWSVVLGYLFGLVLFVDGFFFVFRLLKLLTFILLLVRFFFFLFIVALYYRIDRRVFFSDFFFMFWFSGDGFSYFSKIFGSFFFWENMWIELGGPKGFMSLFDKSCTYLTFFDTVFYKMIYIFVGLFTLYSLYFIWILNRALGLLLIGS